MIDEVYLQTEDPDVVDWIAHLQAPFKIIIPDDFDWGKFKEKLLKLSEN